MAGSSLRPDLHRAQIALDKLEDGSVVLDKWGYAWQLRGVYWYSAGGDEIFSSWELCQSAPIKTVHKAPKRDSISFVNH